MTAAVAAVGLWVVPPVASARVGTDVAPTFQEVHLRADADATEYSGWVRIELDVRKPTSTIRLHAEGQKLERVTLTQRGTALPSRHEAGAGGLLTITAASPLSRGPATLEIHFKSGYNTQAVGLYRMVKDGRGYLFTQFEAEDARKAFPCFDEPGFKFPYQLTVAVPERHQVLSNTPVASEATQDGWRTVVFEKTPPMPSYLLAVAAGPLEFVAIPGMAVPARVVTVTGQSHLARLATEITPPTLAALERYFGMPYPYRKLDLVAVPEYWFGAMENPGAITFSDGALLLDPATATLSQRLTLLRYTAHELAHMWFGDLVTMAWWDDMWLNESFADWMGDKITEELAPEYRHLLGEMQGIQDIMEADARPSTDPIRQPVESGNEAMRAVGLAYNKGKAVLGMFEHWMGPEAFRRGVNGYLEAHAWKNATASDLWRALSKASGEDVTSAMAGYIEQQGLPAVRVELQRDGRLRLTQRRFLNAGVQARPLRWQVPMEIRWSDGREVHTQPVLLRSEVATVKLEGGKPVWVMPNGGGLGYYRWSVPPDMMRVLARDSSILMTPAERIAFLGNAAALLDAGQLTGDAYLELLQGLAGDPEPLVGVSVISGLSKAREAFVPDDLRDTFAAQVRRTLRPMADRFGLERRPGEEPSVSLLRPKLFTWLGREGRDPDVLSLADRLAERFFTEPGSVDPALATPALQLHALRGDLALFGRYRKGFEGASTPSDRRRFLSALGSFGDPALQEAALDYVFQGPLRPNETLVIPRGIASSTDRSRDRVFRWVRESYEKIAGRLPAAFMPFLVTTAGGCSAERLALAREFFSEPARSVPGTVKELAQVGEEVQDCTRLRGREGAAAAAYLRRLPSPGGGAGTAAGSP